MTPDDELLRSYVEQRSDPAFAALVQRHLPLVYATALRRVGGDAHLAQDVAQTVFTALARKAPSLIGRATLAGWLYLGTQHASAHIVRGERRRQTHEQEAHAMQHIHEPADTAADWARVQPAIDAALRSLNDADREAVLLRYFERRPFAEIGLGLKISEDAARMRVDRALEKLRAALARRGITSTAAALSAALIGPASAASVELPLGMAASVTQVALAGASVAAQGAAATAGATLLNFMSTSKIITAASVLIAAAATTVAYREHQHVRTVEASTASTLATLAPAASASQARLDSLNAQLAQASQRIAEVEKDNDALLKAIAAQRAQPVSVNQVPAAQPRDGMVVGSVMAGGMASGGVMSDRADQERLAIERGYMQQLARQKAATARRRAQVQEQAALDPNSRPIRLDVAKLTASAAALLADGDVEGAIQLYQLAMQTQPGGEALPEPLVRGLQDALKTQLATTEITLVSDSVTWVSVFPHTSPRQLSAQTFRLPVGNYEIAGQRAGHQPIRIPLQIRPGAAAQTITVVCTVPTPK